MVKVMKLGKVLSATSKTRWAFLRIAAMVVVLGSISIAPVYAQSAADLKHELDRLKQDLNDMQRYVYQGKEPENIPDLTSSSTSSNVAGQLQAKIQRMEQDLRKLNGRFEEVGHQISTMEGRLDKLITDVDFRLRSIEGQLSGQPVADGAVSNMQSDVIYPSQTNATAQVGNLPSATTQNGTMIVSSQGAQVAPGGELAPGQQSLGQLSPEQMAAFANGEMPTEGQAQQVAPTPVQPVAPPSLAAAPSPGSVSTTASAAPGSITIAGATPQEQYNNAFALLSKRDFDSAEVAFQQFLQTNKEDPLAGNAMYWLGETYYARQNYRESTRVFADAYTKYPEGAKVTDSLLKLAMSLEAIDQIEVACTSYRTLLDEHKNAQQRVLNMANNAVGKLNCP